MSSAMANNEKASPDGISPASRIKISKATQQDQSQIMELARRDHEESVFGELPFTETKFVKQFDKSIEQPGRFLTLKAELNGKVVGFLYCHLGEYFIAEGDLLANVNVLFVDPSVRQGLTGGRVALLLIKAVSRWAQKQGARFLLFYVTSGVSVSNSDRLFRKLGMKTLGGNYMAQL